MLSYRGGSVVCVCVCACVHVCVDPRECECACVSAEFYKSEVPKNQAFGSDWSVEAGSEVYLGQAFGVARVTRDDLLKSLEAIVYGGLVQG